MSKLSDSNEIADEVKSTLDFDEYGAFSDFDIEEEKDYEGTWLVSFKMMDISFELRIRRMEESSKLELEWYEDHWVEFRSYDYSAAKLVLKLLFDATSDLKRFKK